MRGLPSASVRVQEDRKAVWNETRCKDADFFTIGYSGRKADEFIRALCDAGVHTLVDVRMNPVSMYRPEMSKANLERLLAANYVEYLHLPDLGVPRDIRAKAIDVGSRDVIWEWYDQHVANRQMTLHRFFNFADHPVALMCTELDPTECHRHRLSISLEEMGLRGYDL